EGEIKLIYCTIFNNSVGAGSPTIIAQNPQFHKPAPTPPSIPIYLFQNNYKNLERAGLFNLSAPLNLLVNPPLQEP
ncbi:hypothetical protein, partial [Microcoleus sp. B7-D4]|uniref:hypothetical protein n=1 Tax=Microcoleus sp. B7-D4 TaxID=2818696 RepID=UPI002FD5406D